MASSSETIWAGAEIAASLHDLNAVCRKHNGGRPAPVSIAARQGRIAVSIDTDGDKVLRDRGLYRGVGICRRVHDVTPVAPHGM